MHLKIVSASYIYLHYWQMQVQKKEGLYKYLHINIVSRETYAFPLLNFIVYQDWQTL